MLDEPFSGLDPTGVDVMSGVLRERAAAGVPVVFSSHQLELVERLCEDVAIIKDGRLVASGAVDELRERGREEAEQVRVRVEGDGDGALGRGRARRRGRRDRPARRARAAARRRRPRRGARRRPARRDRHALQPGAPDARRPLPPGGGGVTRARGRHARRPARDLPARAREELPGRHRACRWRSSCSSSCCRALLGFGGRTEYTIAVQDPAKAAIAAGRGGQARTPSTPT